MHPFVVIAILIACLYVYRDWIGRTEKASAQIGNFFSDLYDSFFKSGRSKALDLNISFPKVSKTIDFYNYLIKDKGFEPLDSNQVGNFTRIPFEQLDDLVAKSIISQTWDEADYLSALVEYTSR